MIFFILINLADINILFMQFYKLFFFLNIIEGNISKFKLFFLFIKICFLVNYSISKKKKINIFMIKK